MKGLGGKILKGLGVLIKFGAVAISIIKVLKFAYDEFDPDKNPEHAEN